MGFQAFDQVFDPNLHLPGPGGEIFHIAEGSMETGLWCVRIVTAANQVHEGAEIEPDSLRPPLDLQDGEDEETALQRLLLGDANYERLAELGGSATLHAFVNTVMIWHALGVDAAESYWNAGGKAEDFLPAVNRAARREARSTGSAKSTAVAKKTPSRASTSGTTRRKAS